MASRKEEKERLRREREERERAAAEAQRRKRLIGYGIGGVLALAAVVVLAALLIGGGNGGGGDNGGAVADSELLPSGGKVTELKEPDVAKAAKAAGCDFKATRAKSRDHTEDPAEVIRYDSNPPTSGRHFQAPAEDRAYTEAPPDPTLVHALEHGRVNLWFKPSLPRQARADLKALYDRDQAFQALLIPRPDMPYALAATAWTADPEPLGTGQLLGCRTASAQSLDALQAFIEEFRGNGPEPVP